MKYVEFGPRAEKVLLYGVFDPYSEHELEKQLVGLNVEEGFPIFEGIGLQKDSG